MLSTWEDRFTQAVISLWNAEAVQEGYKELTDQTFRQIFRSSPYFDPENTFVLQDGNEVKGFACGCTGDDLPMGDIAGYITCIVLAKDSSTEENFAVMLEALEQRFRTLGKKQAEVLFFNPMRLPWYIPDTPKHEHNNAPGVPVDGTLFPFLLSRGYKERSRQEAMYLPLADFVVPEESRAKEMKALAEGYVVGLLDPGSVHDVSDLLDRLNNPLWSKEIPECLRDGVPVVLAACRGQAAGFAGPVIRQENGRGYFTGMGVHPEHEGHGLGSLLFFKLCDAFQDIGTDYMSLYTGETNPAKRIYEKAGFRTVREFAVMRREL
ncbi:GNAT family N-acetyltransferase [Paenibacillus montanisoli]|uniref:GNAT family N-acetyltransferase n=2 Tax=Paenibacillus montanisoli TaxID=2081970 RepID=A0A328U1D2_9BACL|nr:GNAT family N-acetyltransferase [Paenibacillus montanisoli]RAP75563.1 GNAT family N-acetyltransferase [Paenibacillus montanisoli]